jgi:predicted RNA methylase
MLDLAEVTEHDVVYDLGSGDGRIVIAAAVKYGARGVGIELDPTLIEQSEMNAIEAGVTDRVRFLREDFYKTDIREATVVTLYLFEEANAKLKPILEEQLGPGTRIVTYKYEIPGWTPVKVGKRVFLYVLPEKKGETLPTNRL